MILDDKAIEADLYKSQCIDCKNLIGWNESKCKAFDIIPLEILNNKFKHDKKYPKQTNNILWQRITA